MNDTALVPVSQETGLSVASMIDEKAEAALAAFSGNGYGGFLPRLQLCGASSNLCKEGKVPIGQYAYVKDGKTDPVILGTTVNMWVFGLRLKAMKYLPEAPLSYYDPSTPEFKAVVALIDVPDSQCVAGPDFLVYVDGHGWASFHLSSMSSQNEMPLLKALLGQAATMTVKLAENKKKQKWHVPVTGKCSLPLIPPAKDEIETQILKFKSAKDSKEAEKVVDTTGRES